MSRLRALMLRSVLAAACLVLGGTAVAMAFAYPLVGVIVVVGLVVARSQAPPRPGHSHGSARLADLADLQRAGMLSGKGLILGTTGYLPKPTRWQAVACVLSPGVPSEFANRAFLEAFTSNAAGQALIRVANYVHLATFAPTGRGKSVSVIVPNLLTYPGSCVVIDPKGELYRATSDQRYARGGDICVYDPFGIACADGDRLNPLDFIDENALDFIDQCRDVAAAMVVRTGNEHDPHWNDRAEHVIMAMIAFVCACEPDRSQRNLSLVRELLASPQKMTRALQAMQMQGDRFGGVVSRLGHELNWLTGDERASVMSTVQRHSAFLDGPAIAGQTRNTTFNPRVMRTGKWPVTLYLCLPAERLGTLSAVQRLWVTTLLRVLTRGSLANERRPVLFFLDEAAHLGKIQALEDAVSTMRGMGIRLWFFFQSLDQVKKCFGERASTFLDNIDTQQYFGLNAFESAETISKRAGDATILIRQVNDSISRSRPHVHGAGGHQQGASTTTNHGTTYSEKGRRLFMPDEVLTLPEDLSLVFHRNLPVITTRLFRYFETPEFVRGAVGKLRRFALARIILCFLIFAILGLIALAPDPRPVVPPAPVTTGRVSRTHVRSVTPSPRTDTSAHRPGRIPPGYQPGKLGSPLAR